MALPSKESITAMMDREWLQLAAKAAHERMPDGWCFILMAANVGDDGRLVYASNMTRETAINTLKEWLIKASGEEEWMRHIK